MDRTIDPYDQRLLDELARDGRLSATERAGWVGPSKSPAQVRLRRLIADGYIPGFRAVLDPARMGREHIAFVEVKLTATNEPALRAFNAAVRAIPEIEKCHMIAGTFEVRTSDIAINRQILGVRIATLPHAGNTSTHVSMLVVRDQAT